MYRGRYWNATVFQAVGTLRAIADDAGLPMAELALRWTLDRPVVDAVLIGGSRPENIRTNLTALVLTLANAAMVLEYEPVAPPSLGYTRTMHHSSLLEPGDLWRPNPDEHPHVVGSVDTYEGRLTIIDQDGQSFHYPRAGIIPTAVADPGPATPRLPRTWRRRPRPDRRRPPQEDDS